MIDVRRAQSDRHHLVTGTLITLAVVYVAMIVTVTAGWTESFDLRMAQWAHDFAAQRPGLIDFLDVVALIFHGYAGAAYLLIAAAFLAWKREYAIAIWLVACTVIALQGNQLIKLIFTRERPPLDLRLNDIGGYSFPSGHAVGAGLLTVVLVLFTIILTGRGLKRRVLILLWVLLGLLICLDRILLVVHHVTDVVAGYSFGAFVGLLLWQVIVAGKVRLPAARSTHKGTGKKRSAVILNPVKVGNIDDFKAKVCAVGANHGWGEPLWFETTVEDPGFGQTRAAIEAGVDLIVVAGGDGTVRDVCEAAIASGVAVGVLPLGTGNLLARNLAVPVNTRDALDVVFGGQDCAIDLAHFTQVTSFDEAGSPVVTNTSFLVMAGLGMDAMIMSGVNDELKKKVGYLAYFASGLKALTFPRTKVWITVDEAEPVMFKARTVVVGNVGFLQGGIPLIPDAQIDDGQLDVVVVAPKYFLGWLSILARVITRRRTDDKRLARLSGKTVHVRAERPVPMQLDGDPAGEGIEITATVQPGVVLVRVPVEVPRPE